MSSKQTGKAPAPPVSVDDDDFDDLDGGFLVSVRHRTWGLITFIL